MSRPDYMSPDGARLLAGRIRRYWEERGKAVTTTIQGGPLASSDNKVATVWWIRSDMVDGYPRQVSA